MSATAIERALWDVNVNRESKRRFLEDPARFLNRYQLTEEERLLIRRRDVRALSDRGVSTLLTMGFWMETEASPDFHEYLRRMNAPPLPAPTADDPSGGAGDSHG